MRNRARLWIASAAAPASTPVRSISRPAATPTARFTADQSARLSRRNLQSMQHSQSLPYASSLCGACYEVCPVKINIPEILIHLRGKAVEAGYGPLTERIGMKAAAFALADGTRLGAAQKLARIGQIPFERNGKLNHLPGMLAGWTEFRDLDAIPKQSFREWWAERSGDQSNE